MVGGCGKNEVRGLFKLLLSSVVELHTICGQRNGWGRSGSDSSGKGSASKLWRIDTKSIRLKRRITGRERCIHSVTAPRRAVQHLLQCIQHVDLVAFDALQLLSHSILLNGKFLNSNLHIFNFQSPIDGTSESVGVSMHPIVFDSITPSKQSVGGELAAGCSSNDIGGDNMGSTVFLYELRKVHQQRGIHGGNAGVFMLCLSGWH